MHFDPPCGAETAGESGVSCRSGEWPNANRVNGCGEQRRSAGDGYNGRCPRSALARSGIGDAIATPSSPEGGASVQTIPEDLAYLVRTNVPAHVVR